MSRWVDAYLLFLLTHESGIEKCGLRFRSPRSSVPDQVGISDVPY